MKLMMRYLVAAVMVPVGGVLGACGVMQNRLRHRSYRRRQQQILRDLER